MAQKNPFDNVKAFLDDGYSRPENPFDNVRAFLDDTAGANASAASNATDLYKRLTEEGQTEQQEKKKGFDLGLGLKSVGKSTVATVPVLAETTYQAMKNDLAAPEARAQLADIVTPTQMRSGDAMDYSSDAEYIRLLKAADDAEAERDALYSALGVRKILGGTFAKSALTGEQYQQLKAADQKAADAKTAFSRYNYEAQKAQSDAKLSEEAKSAMEEIEAAQKPVDPNRFGMSLMREANKDWEKATEGLGETGKFIANTGRSIAENAVLLPLAAVNPAIPTAVMGAKSAAQKSYELSEEGVDAGEALFRGVGSGLIEYATEKMPVDNLIRVFKNVPGGLSGAIADVIEQAGMEATEEMVSYIGNYILDVAAADPNAEFSIKELAESGLAGFISGGVMGTGTAAVGTVLDRPATTPENAPVARPAETQENMQAEAQKQPQNVATAEQEQPVAEVQEEAAESAAETQQDVMANVVTPDTVKASGKNNARRMFYKNISEPFNLPTTPSGNIRTDTAKRLGSYLDTVLTEYETTGEISDDTVKWFFDALVDNGVVVEDPYGLNDLKRELATSRVTVPQQNKNDVSEGWSAFLKRNRGNLNIVNEDGIPVDVKYMELSGRFPHLFPKKITDPAGQIMQMSKVAKQITTTETPLAEYIGDGEDFARSAMPKLKAELETLVQGYFAETPDMFGFSERSEDDAPPDVDTSEYGSPLYEPIPPSDTVPVDYAEDSETESEEAVLKDVGSKKERSQSAQSLLGKLRSAIPNLGDMNAVVTLSGEEFSKGDKKLTDQVGEFFKSLGEKVYRRGFGGVTINERSVRRDIAHGIGRAKAVTFAAVPSVIENGRQIDFESNWKGRGYDSYVFAAPVKIGTKTDYVAAVVLKDRAENRFYLHEVLNGNGEIIFLDTKKDPEHIKNGVTAHGGITAGSGSSTTSVAEPERDVKADDAELLRIVSPEYMKAIAEDKRLLRTLYQKLVSGTEVLERIQKKNYGVNVADDVQAIRNVGGIVDFIAERGLVDRNGNIIGKSWKQLVKQIPKGQDNVLQEYWENLHNIDRLKQGKPVLAMTAEESRQRADEIARNHPWVVEQKAEMQKWYDTFMREHVVGAGLMTQKAYNDLQAKYPNYMPTYREQQERRMASSYSGGRRQGIANVIREAVGSTEKVRSLEDTFMENVNRQLRAAAKNDMFLRLYDFAEKSPKEAALYARTVPVTQELQNAYKNGLDEAGAFTDEVDALSLKEVRTGVYQLNLYKNGNVVSLQVSKDVHDAIDRLVGRKGESEGDLTKVGRAITGVPKSLITGYNPFFALTNAIRDVQTGYINTISDRKMFLTYLWDIAKAGKEILQKSADWQLYRANGGNRSGFYKSEAGFRESLRGRSFDGLPQQVRGAARTLNNIGVGIGDAFSSLGEFTENVVRFAEFKESLKQNGRSRDDIKRAMSDAADVTVNFGRNAPVTKLADAWVLYLNAGVQGMDKTARQFKGNPVQTLRRGAEFIIPAAILYIINSANPNYDELEESVKDNYYLVPKIFDRDENGWPKTFIKIPKSREWGAILSGSLERIAGMVFDGQTFEEAFDGFGKTLVNNYAIPSPVTESFVGSLAADLKNNKTWAGGSIVPEYMQDRSPKYQYDHTTSSFAKSVGNRFNVSPKKVDYALDQTTGILWDVVQPMTNEANNTPMDIIGAPLKSKFVADPLYSSKTVDDFYSLKEETAMAAGDFEIENGTPDGVTNPDGALNLYLEEKGRDMSELFKLEKAAEAAGGKDKTKNMQDLRKERNQIAKEALQNAEEYRNVYATYYEQMMPQMERYIDNVPADKQATAYEFMSEYAKQNTKNDMFGKDMNAWVELANESRNPYAVAAEYSAAKAVMSKIKGDPDGKGGFVHGTAKKNKVNALVKAGWSRSRAEALYKALA